MNRSQMIRARLFANDLANELSALLTADQFADGLTKAAMQSNFSAHAIEALERIAVEMGFEVQRATERMQAAE